MRCSSMLSRVVYAPIVLALVLAASSPAWSVEAPEGDADATKAADTGKGDGEASKGQAEAAESPRFVLPAAPAPAAATPQISVREPELPTWLRSLSVGGGALLWYYAPVDIGAKQNVSLFFANLLLDGHFGAVSLHVEPRFRDSRLRSYYPGPVWAQEAYAAVAVTKNTVIKAGKAYSRFGLFWDNSFYGNVQVYDGLKLDPDYGLSLEGALRPDGSSGLRYFAQYFVVDGHTNVSLDGRDTISIPNANRRNQSVARIEPFTKLGGAAVLTSGLSGSFLQAALPTGTKNVYRAAADLSVAGTRWSAWAEYSYQNGQTVTDFPIAGTPESATAAAIPGHASAHNHYGLAGAQYTWSPVTVRYNVSTGRYRDVSVSEVMHVPALAVAVGDNLTVLGEYVDWRRYNAGTSAVIDRSVDVTLNGHF